MSPVSHQAFVAGLSTTRRAQLLARSNAAGARRLAAHLGALSVTGVLIGLQAQLWPLLLPVHGILLVFLFTAMHECTHRTAFRTPWMNRAVAALCGFLMLLPPQWFRHFHFAHHRHTQDPERDPELAAAKPDSWRTYAVYLSGLPTWWSQGKSILGSARGRVQEAFVPAGAAAGVRREARMYLTLYGLLAAISLWQRTDWLIWAWIVPALLGQPFLRAFLLAEHTGCPLVPDMLLNSRTTLTNPLIRLFAWNMPFHTEHHALPAVPFHKLPALHELLRPLRVQTEPGYRAFHRRLIASFAHH